MQRDHLRCDDDQPRDAQAHSQADDDLRQHRRYHDLQEKLRAADVEIVRGSKVPPIDRLHAGGRLHDGRKHRRKKNQKDGRQIADPEPQDRERNPGDRRKRPKNLDQGIQRRERAVDPAHQEAKRNPDDNGEQETGADAKQRRTDVIPQRSVAHQVDRRRDHLQRRGEDHRLAFDDDNPPHDEQQRCDSQRRKQRLQSAHGRSACYSQFPGFASAATRYRRRAQPDSGAGSTTTSSWPFTCSEHAN